MISDKCLIDELQAEIEKLDKESDKLLYTLKDMRSACERSSISMETIVGWINDTLGDRVPE